MIHPLSVVFLCWSCLHAAATTVYSLEDKQRKTHIWEVCCVCLTQPSDKTCTTCVDVFCSSCYDAFHRGRLGGHTAVKGIDKNVLPPITEFEGQERSVEEVRASACSRAVPTVVCECTSVFPRYLRAVVTVRSHIAAAASGPCLS